MGLWLCLEVEIAIARSACAYIMFSPRHSGSFPPPFGIYRPEFA
jgi:hypothetical protein